MARLLAVEWDGREARVAVARRSASSIAVEQAFSIQLDSDSGESVGQQIASTLSQRGIAREETLVGVGRSNIELRVLSVPPAPDDELPEIVRFQAMRQFTALNEDWPLDFVVLDRNDEEVTILAAAISCDLVTQINNTCSDAGLSPRRLVLRPFAAASLLRSRGHSDRCRMMVDLLADEADLTVLAQQNVVFGMRTIRRSSDQALIGEIRRTMVATQNQLGGRRVEEIVLCGDQQDHADLKSLIEEQLSLDTQVINPFDGISLTGELRRRLPDHPGRYAPLLGMLMDEVADGSHSIDFLNPRRRPEPESKVLRNSLVAVLVLVLVLTAPWFVWALRSGTQTELQELTNEYSNLNSKKSQYEAIVNHAKPIDEWVAGDINWLDQLRRFSEDLPEAEKVIVTQMMASARKDGGVATLELAAEDSSTIEQTKVSLRDERHEVLPGDSRPAKDIEGFQREFSLTVTVKKRDSAQPASKPPADKTNGNTPSSSIETAPTEATK